MATSSGKRNTTSGNELKLAVLVGLGALVLLLMAWAFNRLMQPQEPQRPVPAWLGVSKVNAQTADGRMLAVKVNLQLKNQNDLETLAPYEPVFKSLVTEAGASLSSDQAKGRDRIAQFGNTVRDSVNDYLNEQHVKPRVKRVAFEEFTLMPS